MSHQQQYSNHQNFMAHLMQLKIKDPLKYESVEFDDSEWDNIPQIITKMCLNLDKYLTSTIQFVSMMNAKDRQQQLAHQLEDQQKQIKDQEKHTNSQFQNTKEVINKIKENILQINEREQSVIQEQKALIKDKMSSYVQVAEEDLDFESSDYHHIKKEGNKQKDDPHEIPRLFTLNQIRDLVYLHLNRSKLKQQVQETIQNQENLKQAIEKQVISGNITQSLIYKEKADIEKQLKDEIKSNEEYKIGIQEQLTLLTTNMNQMSKAMKNALQGVKQQDNSILIVQDKMEKFKNSMIRQQDQLMYKQKELEKTVDYTVKKMEEEAQELQTKMHEQMQAQAEKFDDLIQNSKEMIIDEVQNDILAGETKINELQQTLSNQLDHLMEEIERKIGKLGSKSDTFTLQVENRFAKLNKQIKKVDKTVYKLSVNNPSTVMDYVNSNSHAQFNNESKEKERKMSAKLFTIESAAKQQDQEIRSEINMLKSVFKKLIITLQCAEIQAQITLNNDQQKSSGNNPILNKSHYAIHFPEVGTYQGNKIVDQQSIIDKDSKENDIILEKNFQLEQKSKIISNNRLQKQITDLRAFDSTFYQRLNHVQKALDQDPIEFEQARDYYNKLTQKNVTFNKADQSLGIVGLDLNNQNEKRLSQVKGQLAKSSLSKTIDKEKLLLNDNSAELHDKQISLKKIGQGKEKTLEIASSIEKGTVLNNIDKQKFAGQELPQRNIKFMSVQNSPTNRKSNTFKQAINMKDFKEQDMISFEGKWDVEGKIKQRRDSFQKRLQLNQTLNH